MSQSVKGGLTLHWLWAAVVMAYLALGFMLPPLDKPMKELSKTKMHVVTPEEQKKQESDIVF